VRRTIATPRIRKQSKRWNSGKPQRLLAADTSTLQTLWADDMVVNQHRYLIAGKEFLLEWIKSGRSSCAPTSAGPVRIAVIGDLVVSTGSEVSQLITDTAEMKLFTSLHEPVDEAPVETGSCSRVMSD